MKKCALIIFIKNCELGKVKTRLARDVGNENALSIYKQLLGHTRNFTESLEVDKYVFYSDRIEVNDLWNENVFLKEMQQGNDLGEKMLNAFEALFKKGYQSVCIIGSDCYELNTDILKNAFGALSNYDSVLGPTDDGGYYLLGLNTLIKDVFISKQWSTDSVFSDTMKDLNKKGLSTFQLDKLSDIDTIHDLNKYPELGFQTK